MVSVRKRKMARSSVKKITRKSKDKQRKINITGNPIIAKYWNYSLTLSQNYKIIGLLSRLGKLSGGTEADLNHIVKKKPVIKATFFENSDDDKSILSDESSNDSEPDENQIPEGEARIHRDSERNITKIVYGRKKKIDIDRDVKDLKEDLEKVEKKTEVVKELEAYASTPRLSKKRVQSSREEEWLEKLYNKHGDNYKRMFFDKKLNIYQQTVNDLKKRVEKWKKKYNIE